MTVTRSQWDRLLAALNKLGVEITSEVFDADSLIEHLENHPPLDTAGGFGDALGDGTPGDAQPVLMSDGRTDELLGREIQRQREEFDDYSNTPVGREQLRLAKLHSAK